MSAQQKKFLKSLSKLEKYYLFSHVVKYDGVEGVTAEEQFKQLISYVLNFLTGDHDLEKMIYNKAMLRFHD